MDSRWLIAYLVLAGGALLQALLLVLQAYEHRRYGRSCMRGLQRYRPQGRAMVLAPCKGLDLDLEENLRALVRQDYHDYEVTFIVESPDDPACPVIQRVMREHPRVAARLLVAGRATECGQKVHNLRMATATLPADTRYLAFVDSDACVRPHWLRLAITRLENVRTGATTGYRWFVSERPSLADLLLNTVNSNIMSLLGPDSHYLLWGGSWAIRRDRFEAIGLNAAWQGALSDDLVASRLLRRARLKVRFEPACVLASPIKHSFRTMFEFIRRQYFIGRYYAPMWWLLALAAASVTNVAWLSTFVAIGSSLGCGTPPLWLPLGIAVATYLAGVARACLVQDLARTYFPDRYEALRAARQFHIWANPAGSVVHWLALLSSSFGQHIIWRGIRYRLFRGGGIRMERLQQEPPGQQPAEPQSVRRAA